MTVQFEDFKFQNMKLFPSAFLISFKKQFHLRLSLGSQFLLGLLNLQNLLYDFLLLDKECSNDALTHCRPCHGATIRAVHSFLVPVKTRSLILRGSQVRNPSNALPSYWTLRSSSPLCGGLKYILTTRGLDHTSLVGFGGIAVAPPVGQTLHHGVTPPHTK